MPATEFIVIDSAARMPANCWGRYRRVAVLEVEVGAQPRMISARARGVVRVVRTWERRHVGKTLDCAFERAIDEAHRVREICEIRASQWPV